MNRTELEAIVAERTRLPRSTITEVLSVALDEMATSLRRGEGVKMVNFGSFIVAKSGAKTGRNPRTGEAVAIPERARVRFRPGRSLAEAIGAEGAEA